MTVVFLTDMAEMWNKLPQCRPVLSGFRHFDVSCRQQAARKPLASPRTQSIFGLLDFRKLTGEHRHSHKQTLQWFEGNHPIRTDRQTDRQTHTH